MPTLHWLTRNNDIHVTSAVPLRALREVPNLSYGETDTANMLIQGDNLEALKALLPFYAGQVKCIYIDPPYNTGSAFEHYDDNLEHTVWLSMMYPRLLLLRELLTENGSIWISIDDDEGHYLKVLCDEIFGRKNFVNTVIWQKKFSPQNDAKWLSDNHDFILCYAKNKEVWKPNLLPRTEEMNARYANPDNDPRGVWSSSDLTVKTYNKDYDYPITTPNGTVINPPASRCWRTSKENFSQLVADNRVWFGENGSNVPRLKRFLSDVKQGLTSVTIWTHQEVGHNQDARQEVKQFFTEDVFSTPKPERLIERILTLGSNPGDIILDSFLGSGTTAAVTLKMGRRFIGIEMGEQAKTHCVIRLRKVIDGEQGGISKSVNWQGGGGFRFYEIGETMFDEHGRIQDGITFDILAAHIWFSETKTPYTHRKVRIGKGKETYPSLPLPICEIPTCKTNSPVLGVHKNTAYALLFNGILHDRSVNGGNVLNRSTLRIIRNDFVGQDYGKLIVFGEWSKLLPKTMKRENIEFRQIPYRIKK